LKHLDWYLPGCATASLEWIQLRLARSNRESLLLVDGDWLIIARTFKMITFLFWSMGAAVGLVDRLTCPPVWLPTYSEDQAFHERL
jgi:hypothetical protein